MPLARTLRWRPLDESGLEHLNLREWPEAIKARGTLIGETDGHQFGLSYEVILKPDWTFETAILQTDTGVMLILQRDTDGRWTGYNDDMPELESCIDIDISGSPFTNTLPIRRITGWVIGEPRELTMAYITVPQLSVRPERQIYTKLSATRFRYESGDGEFTAEIEVDADGLVVSYPPLFTRA